MTISRRSSLALAGAFVAPLSLGIHAQPSSSGAPYSDKSITDNWIVQWMTSPLAATTPLHLGRFADAMYFLREPIGWTPNPGQVAHKPVKVPVGFVTDFASIPRVFWTMLPKDGIYTYAAIIHDYLYWEQPVSRDEADMILRFAMEDFNVGTITLNAVYSAVRLGGAGAWNDNTTRKASGEKRILKKHPSNPTVRWDQWKSDPTVFI